MSNSNNTCTGVASARIATLDALRAFAVIGVFIYHLCELNPILGVLYPKLKWIPQLGNFGVELFYVISGYFIGNAILRPAVWSPGYYVQQRARRILPAYYVSLFILGAISLRHAEGVVNFLLHITMLHTFIPWAHGGVNGVYWTLGVEFSFYILMLALAPFYRQKRHQVTLCLCMVLVANLWRAGVFYSGENNIWMRFFLASQLPGALDAFGWGGLAAVLMRRDWCRSRFEAIYSLLAGVLGVAVIVCCMWYFGYKDNPWFDLPSAIFWRTCLTGGFFLLLLSLAIGGGRLQLNFFARWSGLAFIGKISFSIYLWHLPIMLLVRKHGGEYGMDSMSSGITVMVLATLLVAGLSFYFVERRWHRF